MKTKEVKIVSVKGMVLDSKEMPQDELKETFVRRRRSNEEEQELSDRQYYSMFMRSR